MVVRPLPVQSQTIELLSTAEMSIQLVHANNVLSNIMRPRYLAVSYSCVRKYGADPFTRFALLLIPTYVVPRLVVPELVRGNGNPW